MGTIILTYLLGCWVAMASKLLYNIYSDQDLIIKDVIWLGAFSWIAFALMINLIIEFEKLEK